MKKSLLLTLIIPFTFVTCSFATVFTVSMAPGSGAQYAGITTAYNAASNGDTLLVEGYEYSNFTYSTPTPWAKSLVVIGSGLNADKQNFQKTMVNFNFMGAAGSGSKFYGIKFNGISFPPNENVNDLLFEDCAFSNSFSFNSSNDINPKSISNVTVRNCVFTTSTGFLSSLNYSTVILSNFLFTNCVFNGRISLTLDAAYPPTNFVFDHCVFLNSTNYIIDKLTHTLFQNSIFYNFLPNDPGNTDVSNCVFTNNICRVAGTIPSGNNNSGSNNLTNTDPLFVDVPFSTSYQLSSYSFPNNQSDFNFHLQAGSPAIGAAFDATDIGVHGGAGETFTEEFEPKITPIVRSVNILNATVAPNDTINVQIEVGKPRQ